MMFTIQTDKNEQQRKTFRITAKTENGTTGISGNPFSDVIPRKQEWHRDVKKSANESRVDRSGAGYKYPCIRQVQTLEQWAYQA